MDVEHFHCFTNTLAGRREVLLYLLTPFITLASLIQIWHALIKIQEFGLALIGNIILHFAGKRLKNTYTSPSFPFHHQGYLFSPSPTTQLILNIVAAESQSSAYRLRFSRWQQRRNRLTTHPFQQTPAQKHQQRLRRYWNRRRTRRHNTQNSCTDIPLVVWWKLMLLKPCSVLLAYWTVARAETNRISDEEVMLR